MQASIALESTIVLHRRVGIIVLSLQNRLTSHTIGVIQRTGGSMRHLGGRILTHRRALAASALVILGGGAACSDSTTARANGANELAFTVASSSGATASVVPVTKNGHTLDLSSASVTITRAELKPVREAVCVGDDDDGDDDHGGDRPGNGSNSGPGRGGGDDDCGHVKAAPATIDLPLSGDVVTVPADALPAGTFREIEVRFASLHLTGTFDGQAFDTTIPVNVKGEIEFETPLVVSAGVATTITVAVPVADWFVAADGSLVDPSTIATSPTLLSQFRGRIAATLRAFEDRDHDGRDDRHGHGRG
jgi:hypothetical protein